MTIRYITGRYLATFILIALSGQAHPAPAQIHRLVPHDARENSYFGAAVAIDGSTAIVGASGDSRCGENAGAAYIFERDEGGEWMSEARLEPDDCADGLFFGKSVAVSGDRAAVVSYVPGYAGAANNTIYLFERDAGTRTWAQTAQIRQPPGHSEGSFAATISLDGDRLLVTTAGDASRRSVGGAAYIYDYSDGSWRISARLSGSLGPEAGVFGAASALDGDRAVVAASTYLEERPGSVYVFDRDPATGDWIESAILRGIMDFFISVDVHGDDIIVGESKAGGAGTGRARIVHREEDGRWRRSATLQPPSSYSRGGFGSAVAIHDNFAIVVGFDEQLRMDINIDRVVYLFERDAATSVWRRRQIIDVGDVAFGSAVDLDEGHAVIGQASEEGPGNAYVVLIH